MVVEIIGGAVAQVAQSVGAVAMEAPVAVAQTAVVSAAEVATPVVATVTEGVTVGMGVAGETVAMVGKATPAISQVASAAVDMSEAVAGVQEEVGATLLAKSVAESMVGENAVQSENLASQLEGLFLEGEDAAILLEGLSQGLLTGQEFILTQTLLEEAQHIGDMNPQRLGEIFGAVDSMNVSQEMLEDPTFRADVAQSLFEEAKGQQEQVAQKEDISHMMEKSVVGAKAKFENRQKESDNKQMSPEESERLKKKAALEAVKKQMNAWRLSVEGDKRMSSEAKAIAQEKIKRVETRLLLQTQMQWEGKSLLKMAAVAAIWLTE